MLTFKILSGALKEIRKFLNSAPSFSQLSKELIRKNSSIPGKVTIKIKYCIPLRKLQVIKIKRTNTIQIKLTISKTKILRMLIYSSKKD